MGAEPDPREEGLDVVEEIVIVLSWIPAVSVNLRYYTFGAELCQARNLRTCFLCLFSFFFLHLIIDSHTIPNSAGREFSHSYISLFVCEAGHGKAMQLTRLSSWKKVFKVYEQGRE